MSLSTRAQFLESHMIGCSAPPDTRCTICLDDLDNGEQVIRVEHTPRSHCHFHEKCLTEWVTTVDPSQVVQRNNSLCPNDRVPLFEPERVVTTGPFMQPHRLFIASIQARAATVHLAADRERAIALDAIPRWYRAVLEDYVEPGLRTDADLLIASADPEYQQIGRELKAVIEEWDMTFWEHQRVAMPLTIDEVRRSAVRLRQLGVPSPQADVDRHVNRAEELLAEIEGYLEEGNQVISPRFAIALKDMHLVIEDDRAEGSIRRAGFGLRGLRDSDI